MERFTNWRTQKSIEKFLRDERKKSDMRYATEKNRDEWIQFAGKVIFSVYLLANVGVPLLREGKQIVAERVPETHPRVRIEPFPPCGVVFAKDGITVECSR